MNVDFSAWNVNRAFRSLNDKKTLLDILFDDNNNKGVKCKQKDHFTKNDVYDFGVYNKNAQWQGTSEEKNGQMIPDCILTVMNDNIANLHKSGDIFECAGMHFTANQIPKIDGSSLDEIKAENNVIDFGKNQYFKYVSSDGKEHCLYTDNKVIGSIVSEIMRGEPYDTTLEQYAGFWSYMMSKDPVYIGLSYSDEQIRNYMNEAGMQVGFFTVRMGDREATQFYSATKATIPIQSKQRYDEQYQRLTTTNTFFDSFDPGSIFKIGGKDYVLSESHTLTIPYGEDIYDIEYPSRKS